jgi:hypothetical protein
MEVREWGYKSHLVEGVSLGGRNEESSDRERNACEGIPHDSRMRTWSRGLSVNGE